MFPNTITLNVAGAPRDLKKIREENFSSEFLFRGDAFELRLAIRHTSFVDKARGGQKFDRHNVELTQIVYPVAPATVPRYRKTYIVMENQYDDTSVNAYAFHSGLGGLLTEPNTMAILDWAS